MLTFKKESYNYGSDMVRIYKSDYVTTGFNASRVVNWDSLPNSGECRVYIKTNQGGHYNKVVNCTILWDDNLKLYIEVIK